MLLKELNMVEKISNPISSLNEIGLKVKDFASRAQEKKIATK